MEILNFSKFKLLLEAEGDPETEPATEPVEPPADETPADPAPAADAPADAPPISSPDPMADPFAGAVLPPDPNAPAASSGTGSTRIVFLDKDKSWHSEFTDGGGVKRYKEYELPQADLDKWITDNNFTDKKEQITVALTGTKALPEDVYDKLKSALSSDKLGKDRGDIDINYDDKSIPSTSDLDVIFLKK